jgi:hypothetical protein
MIFELYRKLEQITVVEFNDIVEDYVIILTYSGRAQKLRLKLIDKTFIDVWYSLEGEYSFHWEQREIRGTIYRHDNAPHKKWKYIKTFPKHCHDGTQENVTESYISDIPETALKYFLSIVRKRLVKLQGKK